MDTAAPRTSGGFDLGYARVSTTRQSLERQLEALTVAGIAAATSMDGCARMALMADEDEVRLIEAAMRETGWAEFMSLAGALRMWTRLSHEVEAYAGTIDDYTNDLTTRNYIAGAASRASVGLRFRIGHLVAVADESFRTATIEDGDQRLGPYYRIESSAGWWWHRRPSSGPLADYLDRATDTA